MRRNPVSDNELVRLYFTEGLSPLVIGEQVGMTYRSVLRRLRQAGFTGRVAGKGRWMDSRLSPTEHPTLLDIAWAAGIYEGEGSCNIRVKSDANRSAAVTVSQKDRWLCDRMRALFGGSVNFYVGHGRDQISYAVWNLTGSRGRGFLMTIYKFLSPRRQQRIREAFIAQGMLKAA